MQLGEVDVFGHTPGIWKVLGFFTALVLLPAYRHTCPPFLLCKTEVILLSFLIVCI